VFRDVEIQDSEIEQTSGNPFVAWHAGSVAASFFVLDQETGDGDAQRQRQMENRGKTSAENLKVS
jgi:hypothetical protein